jgi:DNA segregation ATPase FtsK/SpoIIIE-like protein
MLGGLTGRFGQSPAESETKSEPTAESAQIETISEKPTESSESPTGRRMLGGFTERLGRTLPQDSATSEAIGEESAESPVISSRFMRGNLSSRSERPLPETEVEPKADSTEEKPTETPAAPSRFMSGNLGGRLGRSLADAETEIKAESPTTPTEAERPEHSVIEVSSESKSEMFEEKPARPLGLFQPKETPEIHPIEPEQPAPISHEAPTAQENTAPAEATPTESQPEATDNRMRSFLNRHVAPRSLPLNQDETQQDSVTSASEEENKTEAEPTARPAHPRGLFDRSLVDKKSEAPPPSSPVINMAPRSEAPSPLTAPAVPEAPPKPAVKAVEPVIETTAAPRTGWKLPTFMDLLEPGSEQEIDQKFLLDQARLIEDTLSSFGAPGKVVEINSGPVITQFGVEPDYLERRGGRTRIKVIHCGAG